MFEKIQHIGYLVGDLDGAVSWYENRFGAVNAGGGDLPAGRVVASGGRNAFVHFGKVEVELIEPIDKSNLSPGSLVMHHVGYVVTDIEGVISDLKSKEFTFLADAPNVNVLGQKVLYFDPSSTNGVMIHLTEMPSQPNTIGLDSGVNVDHIVHAGYLVGDLDNAVEWYVQKFGGVHIGGGASRRGSRNAFVNFGQVQVELIEPTDPAALGLSHEMDHVGYSVLDIQSEMISCKEKGLSFVADVANTNSVSQQVLYFETGSTMGSRMHLTQLPA